VNDNPVESKRIELYRLPQADNQPHVRFRFGHAGTDSWYFGVDNFGLYSISGSPLPPERPALNITRTGNSVTISWPTAATGFTLEASPALSPATWTPVSGVTGNSVTVPVSGSASYFRLRQ